MKKLLFLITFLPFISFSQEFSEIAFKDGRYKSEITDISIISNDFGLSSGTSKPFKEYFDKKETYKKSGDPEWVYNNPPGGIKIGKEAARKLAKPKQDIYNLICKTESEMMVLLSKLNQETKKPEDAW